VLDTAKLVQLLSGLWRIRVFEEHVVRLSRKGEIPGFIHVCTGQEAVAVGVCDVLENGDVMFSGHRAHGHFLAKGTSPVRLLSEILGRGEGLCGGYAGSMHVVDITCGALGATGVVGGNIPLAAGAAWAALERGRHRIAVVFFGDGASGNGVFHETLNIAALWSLPILFVCENNGYAEFTAREEHSRVKHLSKFAEAYSIRNAIVDGSDVGAIQTVAADLVMGMRQRTEPAFLECMTYRFGGHYVGDAEKYREKLDSAQLAQRDPIARLHAELRRQGLDEATLIGIETETRTDMEAVVQQARAGQAPDDRSVLKMADLVDESGAR